MTPTPNLTPTEAAIVARFDAAPVPEEVLREQVAQALAEAVERTTKRPRDYILADAALAAVRDQQPAAMQRVLQLADELARPPADGFTSANDMARQRIAARIRAAVSGGTGE